MILDAAACYSMLASRDRRFEGRFVVGVMSTGIYCRPGCPAPLPHPRNTAFYACPAAAEEAGFRPCLRCRPDATAGSAAAGLAPALLSRALRLLFEHGLNGSGVEPFAERLGIGSRHLRRLFSQHLGASPSAIDRSRRIHFARRLIEQTDLPMTEIAHASGFPSVRRFNDAIRETLRTTPTVLRRSRKTAALPAVGEGLALNLPFKPPYDWDSVASFLRPRAIPGVEVVDASAYRRTIRWKERVGFVEVRPVPGESCLRLHLRGALTGDLLRVVERIGAMFDLGADPDRIARTLRRDPRLRAAIGARPGLRVPGAWDGFELAVRAILGQQVSVKAATTLAGRLVERFGEPLAESESGLTHLFPSPSVIASLAGSDITRIGLPSKRAETIRALAVAVRDGRLRFDGGATEEFAAALGGIPGIGDWTSQYIALRAFGEPDAFPSSDLGLRRAFSGRRPLISPRALASHAVTWRPWRSYAAMALWLTLNFEGDRK